MTAHSSIIPVRAQSYEEMREQRAEASLARHLATHGAMVDRATEALRRTNAIVDRLCPALPMPSFSTRYGELNSSAAVCERFHDNTARRKALYRAIRPRIEAKVCKARFVGQREAVMV